MRLTKKVRNKIYVEALSNLNSMARRNGISGMGLCGCINQSIILFAYSTISIKRFPEIYKHKPLENKGGLYWFKRDQAGTRKRKKILEEAIKLTQ